MFSTQIANKWGHWKYGTPKPISSLSFSEQQKIELMIYPAKSHGKIE